MTRALIMKTLSHRKLAVPSTAFNSAPLIRRNNHFALRHVRPALLANDTVESADKQVQRNYAMIFDTPRNPAVTRYTEPNRIRLGRVSDARTDIDLTCRRN